MKVPHTLFLQLPQTFVTAYNNKNKGGSFVAADLILQTPGNLPVASAALTVKLSCHCKRGSVHTQVSAVAE